MRLAVIGAGVVGVSTAYALNRDGHEVTVFERCSTAAEGASFANAGLLAPEWMAALASRKGAAGQVDGRGSFWGFLGRSPSTPDAPDPGAAILALSRYGAEALAGLCERLDLEPDSHQGLMVVWREARDRERADSLLAQVRAFGGEGHPMSPGQARELELALNPDTSLDGTLVLPGAWSVNCRQFTLLLRARAQQEGCRFEFGAPVSGVDTRQGVRLLRERDSTDHGMFDAAVICSGVGTAGLLASAGTTLPLQTLTGHSVSASLREPLDAPVAVVHDMRHSVSIARMGQRIRISGPLTPAGEVTPESAFRQLYAVLDDWFPGAIRHSQSSAVQEWHSDVVTTADALPLIGPTRANGVWVNAAHGGHGWVMACGSALLLADQLAGRATAIDASPYSAKRWSP
jgi:D-amino-acid dehydrogenase